MSRLTLATLLSLAVVGCTSTRPEPVLERLPGTQSPQRLDTTVRKRVTYDYLLYLPKDYSPERSYPLVLFLHGAGERGSDVNKVASWGPPRLAAAGQQFDFILASPQCPPGQWWRLDDLEVLLADLLDRYPNVDRARLYLTGLSMGGCATWDWILRSPQTFAAAAPVCGLSNPVAPAYIPKPLTPVWAFHGEKDTVVPPEGSKSMVAAFRKAGAEARLTLYPDVAHNAWKPAYSTPALLPWLLSHRLPTPSTLPAR